MLTGRRAAGLLGAVALVSFAFPHSVAFADDPVTCPPLNPDCDINVGGGGDDGGGGDNGGGGDGSGGGSGSSATCKVDGKEVPCYSENLGWFNYTDECYWKLLDPQPTAADKELLLATTGAPADWEPGDGAFYNVVCTGAGKELAGGTTWSQNPPPGYGGGPTPAELAEEAIKKMRLLGADIGSAPSEGKTGLVGMPVWLWNNKTGNTWGPVTESASAAGITVTATANVEKVVYSMGDSHSITCTTAGTPYKESYGDKSSPDCGYKYSTSSNGQSDNAFNVQGTTTWTIHWVGGGQQGDLTTTRNSATVQLTVGEAQVVAKP